MLIEGETDHRVGWVSRCAYPRRWKAMAEIALCDAMGYPSLHSSATNGFDAAKSCAISRSVNHQLVEPYRENGFHHLLSKRCAHHNCHPGWPNARQINIIFLAFVCSQFKVCLSMLAITSVSCTRPPCSFRAACSFRVKKLKSRDIT